MHTVHIRTYIALTCAHTGMFTCVPMSIGVLDTDSPLRPVIQDDVDEHLLLERNVQFDECVYSLWL